MGGGETKILWSLETLVEIAWLRFNEALALEGIECEETHSYVAVDCGEAAVIVTCKGKDKIYYYALDRYGKSVSIPRRCVVREVLGP